MDFGFFQTARFTQSGLRLRFDGINDTRPDTVTATTAAGVPVDFRKLAGYTFSLTNTNPVDSYNANKGANVNLSRYFDVGIPILFKTGFDVRRAVADARRPFRQWTFVGPDHIAANADNLAGNYDLVDPLKSSVDAPYGNGAWQYSSSWEAYDLYKAHPDYFVHDDVYQIQQNALNSNVITEDVISEFLRFDARLFKNRSGLSPQALRANVDNATAQSTTSAGPTGETPVGPYIRINGVAQKSPLIPWSMPRPEYQDHGAHITNYGDLIRASTSRLILRRTCLRGSFANTIARPNYTTSFQAPRSPIRPAPPPARLPSTRRSETLDGEELRSFTRVLSRGRRRGSAGVFRGHQEPSAAGPRGHRVAAGTIRHR